MKMLSVDDSSIIRKIIRGASDVLGYELLEAANGSEALDVIKNEHQNIHLILLDWNMPVMNGLDTLKALKADDRYQNIPVMMVTTEAEKMNIVAALKAGAKHYLTKPFTSEDLMARMLECMGLA